MRISSIFVVAATAVAASAKNRLDERVAIASRNLDVDIPDLDFALRGLGLDDVLEESGDAENLVARAADDCAGINLRAWPGKDPKNPDKNKINGAEVSNSDCKPANNFNDMQGGFYGYTPKAEKVTASTDPKSALVKKIVSKKQQETQPYRPTTCDHILELNILKGALNDGACELALAMTEEAVYEHFDYAGKKISEVKCTEGQKRIMEIRNVVTRAKNLVLLQSRIEDLKTQITQHMNAAGLGAGNVGRQFPMDFLAMTDYVLAKTLSASTETAGLLDAAIAERFPSAPKGRVAARWGAYLAFVKLAAADRMRQIEDEKRKDGCGTPPPTKPVKRSPVECGRYSAAFDLDSNDITPDNMVTSKRSLLSVPRPVERGWSRWQGSSLERRVVKAPRSGKKAPAGAACPLKNPPPKKVIPKSQTKTRPKPAKKPRQPARRPAPRKPTKKQVAKRPATRARRQPGKQAPRKRATPKRKPKVVPKPTRRPKGKPRARKPRRR